LVPGTPEYDRAMAAREVRKMRDAALRRFGPKRLDDW
jgi:hypothetical protein